MVNRHAVVRRNRLEWPKEEAFDPGQNIAKKYMSILLSWLVGPSLVGILSRSDLARKTRCGGWRTGSRGSSLDALEAAAFPINALPMKQAAPTGDRCAGWLYAGGTAAAADPMATERVVAAGALHDAGCWLLRIARNRLPHSSI
jgi:hypothetical protein